MTCADKERVVCDMTVFNWIRYAADYDVARLTLRNTQDPASALTIRLS